MSTTYTEHYNFGKQENYADLFSMKVITDNWDSLDTILYGFSTGKQDKIDVTHKLDPALVSFSAAQQEAIDSGITAEKVEQIERNKNNISSAYGGEIIGKNKATITSGSNTGRYAIIPCVLSSGITYVLSIGQLSSTDTDSSTCRVVFHYTDNTTSAGDQINRGDNVYISISALPKNADSIYLYPASTGDGSDGKTVTWSDLMVCTSADWAISHDFQPYTMSNAEITAWILAHS